MLPILTIEALAKTIGKHFNGGRLLIAIAGAPGAGKSTLAQHLWAHFEQKQPGMSAIVPMDGFHYDNVVLKERGCLAKKGAPETFDVQGFWGALKRLRDDNGSVSIPIFDRDLDLARAGGRLIESQNRLLLIEGNYLLLRMEPWVHLQSLFDMSIMIDVDEAELQRRLINRWLGYDYTIEGAKERALNNDIPNARIVLEKSQPADLVYHAAIHTKQT